MKKLLIFTILLLLSSCTIDGNNETPKEIENLKSQVEILKEESKANSFDKKLQCGKMLDEEKEYLKEYTNTYTNGRGNTVNKFGEIGVEKLYSDILEIFYSKAEDTCISILKIGYNMDMSHSTRYIIRDILNNKNIGDYYNWDYYQSHINEYGSYKYKFDEEYPSSCEENDNKKHCIEYNKKLKELKF